MPKIEIYTKNFCPYCSMAKRALNKLGLKAEEIDVTWSLALQKEMQELSQRRTVPQIFIDDVHLGGFDDLMAAISSGRLDKFLSKETTSA